MRGQDRRSAHETRAARRAHVRFRSDGTRPYRRGVRAPDRRRSGRRPAHPSAANGSLPFAGRMPTASWTSSSRCSLLELEPPVRQARGAAGAPADGQALAPGPRAARDDQFEHERHLKAINEAADQLERLAEGSRGGRVSRNAVRVSAAAARQAREEAGRRAYEAEQRARAEADGARRARPVRQPGARPLGGAPLRALHLLPGVGRGDRRGHLLHGRQRSTARTSSSGRG